ncbi:hypothetical protein [Streptomyces albicerus]|uniref:hypothetical protein n=1 Tax=Streptomyces albicerus TaxID=2569859 RepID=UPI00124B7971|nr:hypothetical protein [Streptomyces albicerus]
MPPRRRSGRQAAAGRDSRRPRTWTVDHDARWRPRDRRGDICGYTFRGKQCTKRAAHYCEPRADRVVAFFAELLVHTKGPHRRKPFVLKHWQEHEIIRPLFGEVIWSAEYGCYVRRYRIAYIVVARKNGKSELAAGLLLYLLGAARGARDKVIEAIRWLALKVIDFFGNIIEGAAKLFSWVPGVGGKLKKARDAFRDFRDDVNRALGGINNKTVQTKGNFTTPSGLNLTGVSAGRFADGGRLRGGTPGRDSIPILAMEDEYVIRRDASRKVGFDTLEYINRTGELPRFAVGGQVGIGRPGRPSYKAISSAMGRDLGSLVQINARKLWSAAETAMVGSLGSVNVGGSGVQRWAGVVRQALGLVGQSLSYVGITLRRMNQESGGNPRAVNKWDCLTLDAVILTQRGWLAHDEVRVGDVTIGYNPETGRSEWTRITRVVHYDDAPLVKMGNSRWSATTTPNHRWVSVPFARVQEPEPTGGCPHCSWPVGVRRRGKTTAGGLRIHLAKAHGIRGTASQSAPVAKVRWVKTEDIRTNDRLLLAAPADTESSLPITTAEAAVLGWIAGDGHIERPCPTPKECAQRGYTATGVCRVHKARQNPSVSIAQSKPDMVTKLQVLLADVPHAVYVDERPTRNGGKAVGPRYVFRLGYEFAQDLLRRAGHPRDDSVAQVLAMSTDQREAWLEAVINAEGHRGEAVEGHKPQTVIYQRPGELLEAIALAVYLSGARPRIAYAIRKDQPNWSPEALIRLNNLVVTGHSLKREAAGRGAVWCVTTELGSWTARQDDHIFLTGNSNWQRGYPSVGLMQVIRPTFQRHAGRFRNAGPFMYGVSINPLANIYSSMRYALAAYGSLPRAYNRAGGYDNGGMIPPGLSLAYNGTRKPERVLTDRQWSALMGAARSGDGGGDTYNFYPRTLDMTVRDLDTLQRRKDAEARVGKPR